MHNVPQTLGLRVGWGKHSLKWKLIFPVCDSGPEKVAGGSSAAPGAAAAGRALPHTAPASPPLHIKKLTALGNLSQGALGDF